MCEWWSYRNQANGYLTLKVYKLLYNIFKYFIYTEYFLVSVFCVELRSILMGLNSRMNCIHMCSCYILILLIIVYNQCVHRIWLV